MIDKKSIQTDLSIDKVRKIIKENIGLNFAPNQPFTQMIDSSDRLFVGSIDGDKFKAIPNNDIARGANKLIFHGQISEDISGKTIIDLTATIFQNYASLIFPAIVTILTFLFIAFMIIDTWILRILLFSIGICIVFLIYIYWSRRQADFKDLADEYFNKIKELLK